MHSLKYQDIPIIAIVGSTATGKTALAIEFAEQFGGEIICADSRTIYRGLDIGTAKPTDEDRARVPHHLLDCINPNTQFSAAEFKKQAIKIIEDINRRGKVPFLVGGTGLYIDAVLYDYEFGPKADENVRIELSKRPIEDLQHEITIRGLQMPENRKNKQYLIRTLERGSATAENRTKIRSNCLVLGLDVNRTILSERIAKRVQKMVDGGLVEEVEKTLAEYGESAPGLRSTGYRAFIPYVKGDYDLETAKQQFILNDRHLAKRQRTWFRRNNSIHWVNDRSIAVDLATMFLNK